MPCGYARKCVGEKRKRKTEIIQKQVAWRNSRASRFTELPAVYSREAIFPAATGHGRFDSLRVTFHRLSATTSPPFITHFT